MFRTILRFPDSVTINGIDAQNNSGIYKTKDAESRFIIEKNLIKVCLNDTVNPVKYIVAKWKDDFADIKRVLGDSLGVAGGDLAWLPLIHERRMAWYFLANNGEVTHGYGVKTGCNSFCSWQINQREIILTIDVRNGGDGVILKEELLCCEIVECEGYAGETAFAAGNKFCAQMCEKPKLPNRPVFGLNNWYYAYGKITRESVLEDARLANELCGDLPYRPYLLIDDGWQIMRDDKYIGGPFIPNDDFRDMKEVAAQINKIGCEPGLWIRPLLTKDKLSKSAYHPRKTASEGVTFLDPSKDEVLDYVKNLVRKVSDDGYKIIKFDFTAPDMLTSDIYDEIYLRPELTDDDWHFDDRSVTNAQICKKLYETIKDGANGSYIIGCNTYNHLAAGILEIQRSGLDTSGFDWNITRKHGVNCLAFRQIQNKAFFLTDADCPAFTDKVSIEMNMRFLEASAMASNVLFASITPGLLTDEQKRRVKKAFEMAVSATGFEPVDWMNTTCPSMYLYNGVEYSFNWFE